MIKRALPSICLALLTASCTEICYLPPASWFVFPTCEISDNTIEVQDYEDLADGNEAYLAGLRIGVLTHPSRCEWNSQVDGDLVDDRIDENILLAEFLEGEDLFGEVRLVDNPTEAECDYIIHCSVDCMYSIELDDPMYVMNCITLGIGALLGWPHHDSSAFYVAESIVYENLDGNPEVVSGTLAINFKEWYCDNIYWRPDFYEDDSLEPLFEQILYEFLADSGCLAK